MIELWHFQASLVSIWPVFAGTKSCSAFKQSSQMWDFCGNSAISAHIIREESPRLGVCSIQQRTRPFQEGLQGWHEELVPRSPFPKVPDLFSLLHSLRNVKIPGYNEPKASKYPGICIPLFLTMNSGDR